MLRPGFGPGSPARKAGILNRAILPEPELYYCGLRTALAIIFSCGIWQRRPFRCSEHIQSPLLLICSLLQDFWRERHVIHRSQSLRVGRRNLCSQFFRGGQLRVRELKAFCNGIKTTSSTVAYTRKIEGIAHPSKLNNTRTSAGRGKV